MPKSRISRKQVKRLKQKQAYSIATQVRLLAEQLPNQEALKTVLLQQEDPEKRLAMFNFMRPFLRFHAEFPSTLISPGRIITR